MYNQYVLVNNHKYFIVLIIKFNLKKKKLECDYKCSSC